MGKVAGKRQKVEKMGVNTAQKKNQIIAVQDFFLNAKLFLPIETNAWMSPVMGFITTKKTLFTFPSRLTQSPL